MQGLYVLKTNILDRFKNKYRIQSARAQWWDYGWNGSYFITICTHEKEHYFGEIVDGGMVLSDIGKIAQTEWLKTFEIRPDMNLWMGEYVIMPNHFHAIIGIGINPFNTKHKSQNEINCLTERRDAMHCVSTSNLQPKNRFGPQSKNLASIVRGFKIGVSTNCRKTKSPFAWQPRYHDHIIRNEEEFQRISDYIKTNPKNWEKDKFYCN